MSFFNSLRRSTSWGEDVIDFSVVWWKHRHFDNVFITSYKDMKRDVPGVLRQVAAFVGKALTEEEVIRIVERQASRE